MARKHEAVEREFEELLVDILEQDHDLAIRRNKDPLNRRRREVATLHFDYQYASGSDEGKVSIRIEGVPGFSMTLPVDFSDEESLQRCAEDTEGLALFLAEHLDHMREEMRRLAAEGLLPYGRREDD